MLKGIDGVLETAGGILFLVISPGRITHFVFAITRHELMQDPDDWLANALRHAFGHLSAGQKLFGGIYLLAHGIIKLFLVTGLLREKLWAFPIALAVLTGFIGYQSVRVSLSFSWGSLFLTVVDVLVVALVWIEYRHLKERLNRRK